MKAVRIDRPTPGSLVSISSVPVPSSKPGWVLVEVETFGLNDSERQLRESEILQDWITKPIIPGVECTGMVVEAPDGDLVEGQRVIACMGGLGCAFDGTYAQYALVPRQSVFTVPESLSWTSDQLGAFPETYSTAWGSLMECLQIQPADKLVIRGATCALGYASIQVAHALGCRVIATTHKSDKLHLLEKTSVDMALLDTGKLAGELEDVDKILDLVGPASLRDTLALARSGTIVCSTGFLGGHLSLDDFDPVSDIPNGVHLTSYSSSNPEQSMFDDIFEFMTSFGIEPLIGSRYGFDEIGHALDAQDRGLDGKAIISFQE